MIRAKSTSQKILMVNSMAIVLAGIAISFFTDFIIGIIGLVLALLVLNYRIFGKI